MRLVLELDAAGPAFFPAPPLAVVLAVDLAGVLAGVLPVGVAGGLGGLGGLVEPSFVGRAAKLDIVASHGMTPAFGGQYGDELAQLAGFRW